MMLHKSKTVMHDKITKDLWHFRSSTDVLLDAEQIHSVIFQKELFLNFFFKLLHCEEKVKAKKCNRKIFFLLYKSMTPKKKYF